MYLGDATDTVETGVCDDGFASVDPEVAASATAPSAPATSTTPTATITARGMPMAPARRRRFGGTGPRDAPSSARSAEWLSACSMRSVMVSRPRPGTDSACYAPNPSVSGAKANPRPDRMPW